MTSTLDDLRLDYEAARRGGRFMRARSGVPSQGANGDYHIRNERDLFFMVELSRDMARNDIVLKPALRKTATYVMRKGFKLVAQSPDEELNEDIQRRFAAWASDSQKVDRDGEFDFNTMAHKVLYTSLLDGEMWPILYPEQNIGLYETHRVRKPTGSRNDQCVMGVEYEKGSRRRKRVWFTRDEIDPNRTVKLVGDMDRVDVFDANGLRVVLQVGDPERVSQTRCLPVITPVIRTLSQIDDTFFAKLLQQQAVSIFAFIRTRDADSDAAYDNPEAAPGAQREVSNEDGTTSVLEKWGPAMDYQAPPGETVQAFSPKVPSAEFFPHMKLMLQLVGAHFSLPLVLMLLDGSETNFSGWRGALDAAKAEFETIQEWMVDRFHRPVALWWLHNERLSDPELDRRCRAAWDEDDEPRSFPHRWARPAWPYIEPKKDAEAEELKVSSLQTSPQLSAAGRGLTWDETIISTVEAYESAVNRAKAAAKRINDAYPLDGDPVSWRDMLFLIRRAVGAPAPDPEQDEDTNDAEPDRSPDRREES
ncbi:MAG: phage portal protein [Planctomycetota bacterium]